MGKINSKLFGYFIIIYFILYLLLTIFSPSYISITGNSIFSIIGSSIAGIILFILADKLGDYSNYTILLAISAFMYSFGSVLTMSNPSKSPLFYILCNLFIFIAIWSLVLKKLSRWRINQLVIDGFVFSVFIMYIACTAFIKDLIVKEPTLGLNGFFYVNLIISDFLIVLSLSILYHSLERTKNTMQPLIIFSLWSVFDITYYYLNFKYYQAINTNSYTILSLLLPILLLYIAYLANKRLINNDIYLAKNNCKVQYKNFKRVPLSIIFLFLISIFLSNGNMTLLSIFIVLIIGRQVLSKCIYTFEINQQLTDKYKVLTEDLERKINDRTSELTKKNKELYNLANVDPLTYLPNRRNFVNKLDRRIAKQYDSSFALLFIDLDRFKSINDFYGHDVGDLLIVATAERLRYNLSSKDFVARVGGDEFVALIDNIDNLEQLIDKLDTLISAFRIPFKLNGLKISSSLSIGISMFPHDGTTRSDLMKYADIALYQSKANGKNRFCIYNPSLEVEENKKLEIENRLYDAITNNEFELYYQPQVDTQNENIIGIEALIRWRNPELGFIPPNEFISVAEDSGLIISIGEWVLEESCKTIKYLNEKYGKNIKIGVNVSPKQFLAGNLVNSVKTYIDLYDLDGSWLDIEITETCSIQNEENTLRILQQLKHLGVNISIDDFGIGYSSLSYLKRYPIDTLKIAMELTRGIHTNLEDYKIVKAIISMCKDLNLSTIAEGIEEAIQVSILRDLGCKEIQGYYYGKPMTFEDLEYSFFRINKELKNEKKELYHIIN